MTVRHRQNCQKHRITCDPWIRITDPGTRSRKSVSNIEMLLQCLSLYYRWKITVCCQSSSLYPAEALNYVVINNFLFRIDTHKDKDRGNENSFLLVIPEKYEPIIFHMYHDSFLAGHQGPYRTAMTIRQSSLFVT